MQARSFSKILFFILVTAAAATNAQTSTSSPYSRFGIGDLQTFSHARNAGMGGLSFAVREDSVVPDFINFNNPASYTAFKFTAFDAGITGSYANLKNSRNNETVTNASVQYFGFGFPVTKWWGGCFGLKPYSSIGYGMSDSSSVSDTISGTTIPVQNGFSGKGGLNQFFIGSSIQPFKNSIKWFHKSERYKNLQEGVLQERNIVAAETSKFRLANKTFESAKDTFRTSEEIFEAAKQTFLTTKDSLPNAKESFKLAKEEFIKAKERCDVAKEKYLVDKKAFNDFIANTDSCQIKKTERCLLNISSLSFGVNSSFLFGTLDRERRLEYNNSSYFDFKQTNSSDLGGLYFNLGAQYSFWFKNNTSLVLGAVFTPSTTIKGTQTILAERYQRIETADGGYDNIKDTVKYEKSSSGSVTLPMSFGGGIVYKKAGSWQFGVDYLQQSWSKYQAFGQTDGLSDSWRISGGAEIAAGKNKSISSGKTIYRLGGYFMQTYLQLKETQLNDYGITFGIGFPIARKSSMLNIAFEIGERGTTANDLIKEQYVNLRLGFTFNDKWFLKRKYD